MGSRTDEPRPLTLPLLLRRGLTVRCPLCGGRGLFQRWFTMVDRCPRCRLRTERVEGHWLGSLGMNTIVSFAAVLLAVVLGVLLGYPDALTVAVVGVVATAVIVPIAFFPVSRTLWSAIDLAMRPLEPDDDVDPRWIPPASRHEA